MRNQISYQFTGKLWLEVFIAAGVNDSDEQVRKIAALVERIGPDRVQLNTATRPTAEADVAAVSPERLAEIAELIGPRAEVIASFKSRKTTAASRADEANVLAIIRRRPVTAKDIAARLGGHPNEVTKAAGHLMESGAVVRTERQGQAYYEAVEKP